MWPTQILKDNLRRVLQGELRDRLPRGGVQRVEPFELFAPGGRVPLCLDAERRAFTERRPAAGSQRQADPTGFDV